MFRELINKLKTKKQKLEDVAIPSEPILEEKEDFEITFSKGDNYFKMEISDYIKMGSYFERIKEIETFGVEDLIGNAVWWNSARQRVNRGTFYIIVLGNQLYNILIDGDIVMVDERIKRDDEVTEERYVRIDTANNDYNFALHHHDSTGDTFLTRFFSKKGPKFGKLELTEDEFVEEIRSVIVHLEAIEGIDNIFDVSLLKRFVLGDFEDRVNQKIKHYGIEDSK